MTYLHCIFHVYKKYSTIDRFHTCVQIFNKRSLMGC